MIICSYDKEEELPGGGWRREKCANRCDILNGKYAGLCYGCAYEQSQAENKRLRKALQELYDEQNGPPLIRDKDSWQAAMSKAEQALKEK